jgi:hypothetical protein
MSVIADINIDAGAQTDRQLQTERDISNICGLIVIKALTLT